MRGWVWEDSGVLGVLLYCFWKVGWGGGARKPLIDWLGTKVSVWMYLVCIELRRLTLNHLTPFVPLRFDPYIAE